MAAEGSVGGWAWRSTIRGYTRDAVPAMVSTWDLRLAEPAEEGGAPPEVVLVNTVEYRDHTMVRRLRKAADLPAPAGSSAPPPPPVPTPAASAEPEAAAVPPPVAETDEAAAGGGGVAALGGKWRVSEAANLEAFLVALGTPAAARRVGALMYEQDRKLIEQAPGSAVVAIVDYRKLRPGVRHTFLPGVTVSRFEVSCSLSRSSKGKRLFPFSSTLPSGQRRRGSPLLTHRSLALVDATTAHR